MAGFAASVFAQEYSPVVEDRVEYGVMQPPVSVPEQERRGGLDLGLVISAAYDDNIFLSSISPESDMVFRVAPSIAYTKGDENEGEGGFVKVGYRPTGVFYAGHGSENRVDHQAIIAAGWRGKVTRLTYEGAFQKLGDATANTGQQTDRLEMSQAIRAAWIPREKLSVEVAAGNRQTDYSEPDYYDSSKTYGEVAVRYTYSPKTELGLIYQIGRLKVDGTGPQDVQQLTGAIAWQPREKIRLNLEAGAEHRKSDSGTSVNPVLQGGIHWLPRQGTDVFVSAYMRQEASALYAGQNYSVNGVAAGISQRLGDHLTAKLEGGFEKNSYESVAGSAQSGREDRIWFVRPALVCRVGQEANLSLFYRISDNSSSDSLYGYEQQMIGIEFDHKF